MSKHVLNITSKSSDWRAYALSNFPMFPFFLDGILCVSVEGFIQGIKYPRDDPRRGEAFLSWGKKAKVLGEGAGRNFVWWQVYGEVKGIPYGSLDHHALIKKAIRSKFAYNNGALQALMAVSRDKLVLTHDVGPEDPNTSLPANVFCNILNEIIKDLRTTGKIGPYD